MLCDHKAPAPTPGEGASSFGRYGEPFGDEAVFHHFRDLMHQVQLFAAEFRSERCDPSSFHLFSSTP